MIKRITSFTSLLAIASASFAADLSGLITNLNSDNYKERQSARLELRQVLLDTPATERGASEAQLLENIGPGKPFATRDWSIRVLALIGDEASVAPLAALLNDPDAHIADCARRALAANSSPKATEALVAALKQDAQIAYLDALAYRGDPAAVPAIGVVLSNGSPEMAAQAALALGKIGGADASAALLSKYSKADAALKTSIELALLDHGNISSDAARVLATTASSGVVRVAAYEQQTVLDASGAMDTLQIVLKDESFPEGESMVRVAIGSPIAGDAIALLPSMSEVDQTVVLAAIADLNLTQYEDAVLALLQSPSASVKQSAIRTLGVIGTIKSYEPLYALYLKNSSDAVVSEALSRLNVPSADAALLSAAKDKSHPAAQVAGFQLLELRNTDGVTAVANELAQPGNDEDVRKAAFKAMESIGDGESIRTLLNIIVTQDSMMRAAQGSLKKLSDNVGGAQYQWTEYYLPALQSAPSDDARKGVLAILDGISCEPVAQYLQQLIATDSPLRGDAIKSLSRWSDLPAAQVWISLYNSDGVSDADKTAALRGLKRVFSKDDITGDSRAKVEFAVELIQGASTVELKDAIVSGYEGRKIDRTTAREVKRLFKPLATDPDVGPRVKKLL
ncbi:MULTISPECIES: HEAT repeat domain-containing protein [unclassified Lentimonas]|uniref:HEAT repeat domain-containing protein n=1 Tax=unclassified Lentimonas TaxID=2630993 RepID=UPI00132A2FD6|nr:MULTISPECIES: HEAT repeat domain-containing protein [unclassified Lentimonas]CAA6693560.1 Unannotated [Lentimonas sp. CC19]CAA6695900.1 Unannotated [Lentimonas sp. CC10]CAA7069806.1 Unannotated [Lentimonas sp. CC11]